MSELPGSRALAVGLMLVVALSACRSEERQSTGAPEHAFEAWVEAMRLGDDASLQMHLPSDLLASVVASADAWERVYGERRPLRSFLEPVWLPRPADVDRKERIASDEEGHLTLRVFTYAGAVLDVPMVREPHGWTVRAHAPEEAMALPPACAAAEGTGMGAVDTEESVP